jgi:hypothetical protein
MNEDKDYNEAAAAKLAEQWTAMWAVMVRGGLPPKDATRVLRTYIKATFGHMDWRPK